MDRGVVVVQVGGWVVASRWQYKWRALQKPSSGAEGDGADDGKDDQQRCAIAVDTA